MKSKPLIAVLFLVALMVSIPGCDGEQNELEIKAAIIEEVDISIAESDPQKILVYIKGGLADSCTTFHDLTAERSGNTITIEVTTERPVGAICAQIYRYFEKNVSLGSDFTSGETYTVDVNGVVETFEYP